MRSEVYIFRRQKTDWDLILLSMQAGENPESELSQLGS